jgi:hypothetical protein
MIKFDATKLRIEYMKLKSCTTSLGGSITVLDEEKSTPLLDKYKRISSPFAVTRSFIKRSKSSSFFYATPIAVTFYDDIVVALEKSPYGNLATNLDGESIFGPGERWISASEFNINRIVTGYTAGAEWFIDGNFIFRINKDIAPLQLSSDGLFKSVSVHSIKLADISIATVQPDIRTSLAFCVNGRCVITPPVWKTLANIGQSKLTDDRVTVVASSLWNTTGEFQFDKIDEQLAVNLNFALSAARAVSEVFGYDYIEPLNLPEMMIRLNTVNLPNVDKSVKATIDIGVKFTHIVAWLIGLTERLDTLESYMVLRDLLKYVTTKGVFKRNVFDLGSIFKDGYSIDNVPVYEHDEVQTMMEPKPVMQQIVDEIVGYLKVA